MFAIPEVLSAMQSKGFYPTNLIPDGVIHRFARDQNDKKKTSWYVLYECSYRDGTLFHVAVWGDWRDGSDPHKFQSNKRDLSLEEREEVLRRIENSKRQQQEALEKQREETSQEASKKWNTLVDNLEPDYLYKKGIPGSLYGCRAQADPVGNGVSLYIPLRDTNGKIWSLQKIAGSGQKLFLPGGKKNGNFHLIGEIKDGSPILIAEGFATAVSIHKATELPVVVAFDAGNLTPSAKALRGRYPNHQFIVCGDDDQFTEQGNTGKTKAQECATAVGGICAFPCFKDTSSKPTDFNDLHCLEGLDEVRSQILKVISESSNQLVSIRPLPLRREIPDPEPYPIDALGPALAPVAELLAECVQAPDAICAQSILAVAALAVQGHANVVIDGRVIPLSGFFISISESGERKSGVDREALKPVREFEKELSEKFAKEQAEYENDLLIFEREKKKVLSEKDSVDIKSKLQSLTQPQAPLHPILTTEEPTYEGLVKHLANGQPSMGLFSDEGGRMIGGHSMSSDQQLKTAAGLSGLWDGKPIDRVRGGDGALKIFNRRVSLHLMMQQCVSDQLLSNQTLLSQGLIARCLTCSPRSTAGGRFYRSLNLTCDPTFLAYKRRTLEIFHTPLPLKEGNRNELNPRELNLSVEAKALWIKFHDAVEKSLAENGLFARIRAFGSKSPEHALRLAGILTLFKDIQANEISLREMEYGIKLTRFYLGEALRLFDTAVCNPELLQAQKLLLWLQDQETSYIYLQKIYQRGPNSIRDAQTAKKLVKVLEAHNWLVPVPPMEIDTITRQAVWEIRK